MGTLKLALRAYRDYYDHIWIMLLMTAVWWCLVVTVAFAPSATLLLFRVADPRKGAWDDRIGFREASTYLWTEILRGWKLALATIPLVALLAFNLQFYGGSDGVFALLSPVWLLLLIIAVTSTLIIFALGGMTNLPAGAVVRKGWRVTGLRLPGALLVILITFIIPATIIGSVLYFILPVILVLPGILAIGLSRFVLKSLGEAYPEPNKPTEERLHEKRPR